MDNSLRAYRERHGLSQGALAERVGVTRQTINAVEGDRYDPSLELALDLAAFFECPMTELFHPAETPPVTVSDLPDRE